MADIENILITLVIFSLVVMGGVVFITGLGEEYDSVLNVTNNYTAPVKSDELESLNVIPNVTSTTRQIEDYIQGEEDNDGIGDFTDFGVFILTGIGSVFLLLFQSIIIPFTIVPLIVKYLGLPIWVAGGINVLITIVFIFILLRIILKREGRI